MPSQVFMIKIFPIIIEMKFEYESLMNPSKQQKAIRFAKFQIFRNARTISLAVVLIFGFVVYLATSAVDTGIQTSSEPRIAMILPYTGEPPEYARYFFKSVENKKNGFLFRFHRK
eukprot:NODE_122_length_17689_cov_1.046219.p12 type:complete len:115 gc:universal NODE_122_length_17689_cov_1.046219:12602-12946(+)